MTKPSQELLRRARDGMKLLLRIVIGIVLAVPCIPIVLAFFLLTSPYWVLGGLISLADFVIVGEWEWPEIG